MDRSSFMLTPRSISASCESCPPAKTSANKGWGFAPGYKFASCSLLAGLLRLFALLKEPLSPLWASM